MKVIIGIFIMLHGLVHLFYFAHSKRIFELRPGFEWPDNSWVLAKFMGTDTIRTIASLMCILVAAAFAISGIAYITNEVWTLKLIQISAILSTVIFILFWDGRLIKLDNQGAIAIIINISIWFVVSLLQ
ncbi:hypothetical protein [Mariniphaga sp.]|uniref:hypothetical protein n=1 Tax=Mariniphaga sp. TaxID=1954475 RepID=UPI00356A4FEB